MIDFRIEAPSLNRLRRRLQEAPRIVREEMRAGMETAGEILRDEVQARTPVDTGRLRKSVSVNITGGGAFMQVTVGSDVEYARWVEEGTRPHVIVPRRARALRFLVGGRVVFARRVMHPGTQGAAMFREGWEAAQPRIRRVFAARLGRVTRRLSGR